MTPTPTDPREEPSETGMPCASDHGVKVLLAEDKEPIDPKDAEIAKLAAEIAELKAELEHYGSVAEWMGKPTSDLHTELIRLRAELEAARKERDEEIEQEQARFQSAIELVYLEYCPDATIDGGGCDSGDPLDFTVSELRQAFNHITDQRDTALAAKEAAEKENKELREREGQLVIKWEGQQDRANQLESKLATLCAAKEKRVAEALPIISDALSELSLTLANTERRESADCRLAAYLKASRASELIAALTPAPTQEPPAGGVTISNDSSSVSKDAASLPGPKESAETRPNAIPESSEGCASPAVTPSTSPADVPSEGRGELLPFNLSDALAGKPVVTRDRRRASKIQGTDRLLGGTVNGIYYNWYLDGKCTNGNPLHDLFMLPTEGSGA